MPTSVSKSPESVVYLRGLAHLFHRIASAQTRQSYDDTQQAQRERHEMEHLLSVELVPATT
jgi:hypothetical protein